MGIIGIRKNSSFLFSGIFWDAISIYSVGHDFPALDDGEPEGFMVIKWRVQVPDIPQPSGEQRRHLQSRPANRDCRSQTLWEDSQEYHLRRQHIRYIRKTSRRSWWWKLQPSRQPSLSCSLVEVTSTCPSADKFQFNTQHQCLEKQTSIIRFLTSKTTLKMEIYVTSRANGSFSSCINSRSNLDLKKNKREWIWIRNVPKRCECCHQFRIEIRAWDSCHAALNSSIFCIRP